MKFQNCEKTFCQTPIDALKKRRCCHKCCEWTEYTSRGSLPQSILILYAHCSLQDHGHNLLARFMATVEVFHKAASVRSSSKITNSFVASFPGLPNIIAFRIHPRHFRDQQSFFRESIQVWQKVFPEFIASQLQIAVQLAHWVLIVL